MGTVPINATVEAAASATASKVPAAPFMHPQDPLANFELDIIGQQPALKIYTQIAHCYALPAEQDISASKAGIVSTLEKGLARLAEAFPWTAGKVVQTSPSDNGTPASIVIKPHQPTAQLTVKDLTEGGTSDAEAKLTMKGLEESDFPISMLHEDVIAPRTTLPIPTGDSAIDDVWPVFLVQATFIDGGLILCLLAHHGAMDMVGQAQVIAWLSKACEAKGPDDKIFTDDELRSGNRDRRDLIPFLSSEEFEALDPKITDNFILKAKPVLENKDDIQSTSASTDHPPAEPSPVSWTSFTLSAASLSALKAETTRNLPPGSVDFISTDDALTSLIWTTTARARSPRLTRGGTRDPASVNIPIARAVDIRSYFSLPKTYPGLFQNMTYASLPLSLCQDTAKSNEGLGAGAAALRKEISPATSTIQIRSRALATYIKDPARDNAQISLTANLDASGAIMLSSWAATNSYELEFGLGLGGARGVRRPCFTPVEGLVYLLPKTKEGDINVVLALKEDEIEALKGDEVWSKYARYVG